MYWITESENMSRRTKIKKNENKNKQRVKKQHTYTTYTKQDTFSIYDIIETIDEKKRKKPLENHNDNNSIITHFHIKTHW